MTVFFSVDFRKLCLFYNSLSDLNPLKNKLEPSLKTSYELMKYRKEKLKTGDIKFNYNLFYYNGILLYSWFEPEYKNQLSHKKEQKEFEDLLKTLSLKRDLQTFVLVILVSGVVYNYLKLLLQAYCYNFIFSSWKVEVRRYGLRYVLDLFSGSEPRSTKSDPLTDIFIEGALLYDIF